MLAQYLARVSEIRKVSKGLSFRKMTENCVHKSDASVRYVRRNGVCRGHVNRVWLLDLFAHFWLTTLKLEIAINCIYLPEEILIIAPNAIGNIRHKIIVLDRKACEYVNGSNIQHSHIATKYINVNRKHILYLPWDLTKQKSYELQISL